MSNDNNILIEIKSAFERRGTDEAERAQDRLASKTKDLNRTFQDNEKDANKARQALAGMSAASAASQGSFGGLSRVLESFSGRLADVAAKASLVAGAFSAGYGLGTAIDRWLGISKAVADAVAPAQQFATIQDRIRAQIGDLNAASLAAVKKEFDSLYNTLQATTSEMDRLNGMKNRLTEAEGEASLAEVENMPPGPARDRAILAKRREVEASSISAKIAQGGKKLKASEETLEEGRKKLTAAQDEEAEANFWFKVVAKNKDVSPEDKAVARLRLDAAELKSKTTASALTGLEKQHSKLSEETSYDWRVLRAQDRASQARFSSGSQAITAREQEEAARQAARRQGIRENLSNDMRGISADATRSALQSELGGLSERADTLRSQGLPAARVQDLRSKASGASKQADSAVAAVSAVLDSITARMRSLEDKLKNLPR